MKPVLPLLAPCDLLLLPIVAFGVIVLTAMAFCVDALLQGPSQGFRTSAHLLTDFIYGPKFGGEL